MMKKIVSTFIAVTMCAGLAIPSVSAEMENVVERTVYEEDFNENYNIDVTGGDMYIGTDLNGNADGSMKNYKTFQYSNSDGNMNVTMDSTKKDLTITTRTNNSKGVLFVNRNMLYNNMSSNHEISVTAQRNGDNNVGTSSIHTAFGMRLRSHTYYNKDYYEAGISTSYIAPGGYDETYNYPDRPYILKFVDQEADNFNGQKGNWYIYPMGEIPRLNQSQVFDMTSGVVTGTDGGVTYDKIYTTGRFIAKGTPSQASGSVDIPADTAKGVLGGNYKWTTENIDGTTYVSYSAYILDSKRFYSGEATDIGASQSGLTLSSWGDEENSATSDCQFTITKLKVNAVKEELLMPEFDLHDGKTVTPTFTESFSANATGAADSTNQTVNVNDDWMIRTNVNASNTMAAAIDSTNKKLTLTEDSTLNTGVLELKDLDNKGLYKNPNYEITLNGERLDDGSNGAAEIVTAFGVRLKGTGTYKKTYYEAGISSSYFGVGPQYINYTEANNDRPYILKVVDGSDSSTYPELAASATNNAVYHYMLNDMPRLKQWEPFTLTGGTVSGTLENGTKYDKIYVTGSYQVRDMGSFAPDGYTEIPADSNIAGGAYKYSVLNNVCTFEAYIIDIKPFYSYNASANKNFTTGISLCSNNFNGCGAKFDITGVTLSRLGDEVTKPSITATAVDGTVNVNVVNAASIMDDYALENTPVIICAFYDGNKLINALTENVAASAGSQSFEFEDPQTAGEKAYVYLWDSVGEAKPIYEIVPIK